MALELVEQIIRWSGIAGLLVFLIVAGGGFLSVRKRPRGRSEGKLVYRWPVVILIVLAFPVFFGICYILWRPIPLEFPLVLRWIFIILGPLLYFGGIAFYVWGRFTMGKMFGRATTFEVRLYADHKLVTHGPFGLARHPLYLGMMIAVLGALFIYMNWTMVFLFGWASISLSLRARKEENALAKEFGQEWTDYCRRVPAFIPRLFKKKPKGGDCDS